jgi:hypothetical protein
MKQHEHGLFGNMIVSLVEQEHLQPALDELLTGGHMIRRDISLMGTNVDLTNMMSKVVTLNLPRGALSVVRDVPPRDDGRIFAPTAMSFTIPEVREIYAKYVPIGPDAVTLSGSAAKNWLDLDDRMRWILVLFRTAMDDSRIEEWPLFNTQQRQMIIMGGAPLDHGPTCMNANQVIVPTVF